MNETVVLTTGIRGDIGQSIARSIQRGLLRDPQLGEPSGLVVAGALCAERTDHGRAHDLQLPYCAEVLRQ
jgi:hypothetical protein